MAPEQVRAGSMVYRRALGGQAYVFADLRDLLAKATPLRSGDMLAGVAAGSAAERAAAKHALADVPLAAFLTEALVLPGPRASGAGRSGARGARRRGWALLGARHVVMLIGERPGLSAADSFGADLTFEPRIGRTDAERNCVSNIRDGGLRPADAGATLAWLVERAFVLGLRGVALKDESAPALARLPEA